MPGEKKEWSELVLVEVLSRFVVGFLLFLLAMMVSIQRAGVIFPSVLMAMEGRRVPEQMRQIGRAHV